MSVDFEKLFSPLHPTDRGSLIAQITHQLGDSLIRVLDTHNTQSIIFIASNHNRKYVIKAEYGIHSATHREIDWYESVKKFGSINTAKMLYAHKAITHAILALAYIEHTDSLDDMSLNETLSSAEIFELAKQAFEQDRRLFEQTAVTVGRGLEKDFFATKYDTRKHQARRTEYLAKMYDHTSIIVNGRRLLSIDAAVNKIQRTPGLNEYLTSSIRGLIHGDLHCGNILIQDKRLYLIDPNGALELPLEYDIGKLFHSMHGGYGAIMKQRYSLTVIQPGVYEFDVSISDSYRDAFSLFSKHLSSDEYIRGLYAEAMHFATMLPHHAAKPQETIALFIRSAQLFEELFNALSINAERPRYESPVGTL